jgi:hypothetical protein
MAKKTNTTEKQINQLVKEALDILHAFGIPLDGTERRKQRMAKAFLAVAGVKPGLTWADAMSNDSGHRLLSRQVLRFMNDHLGENIADSSYDDIRREDLILPVMAGIVLKSAANPNAVTNDGTRAYALSEEVAVQVRLFGMPSWEKSLHKFLGGQKTLVEQLNRQRDLARVPVTIKEGHQLHFSPGPHNELQKKIIEVFLPLFGHGAEVLYVGDTAKKFLFIDKDRLGELKFFELAHDKLPDVVAYSPSKNWLFLVEAVHSANPISELRRHTLEAVAGECTANLVYVTAFPNRVTFRKHLKDIAWETEVWIADAPEHLIHFNGDKFLGPYQEDAQ